MIKPNCALAALLCTAGIVICRAQTGNLTSSPYSLFGLGQQNDVSPGKTNGLGRSGIALGSESEINGLNPAAYATIPEKSFYFDIGMKNRNSYYVGRRDEQGNSTYNFSNISLAFALNSKSGVGISLFPYTDVGYTLSAVAGTIEGSSNPYISTVRGSGGLNNLQLAYGTKLFPSLNVGAFVNIYFGKINEVETVNIGNDNLILNENHFYNGFRFTLGAQYRLNDHVDLGFIVNLPASLSGAKSRTVYSDIDNLLSQIEADEGINLRSFKMPVETGAGFKLKSGFFTFNGDYRVSFWEGTNRDDVTIVSFANQHTMAGGAEYFVNEGRDYINRMRFRIGGSYDNGYIKIASQRVQNFSLTAGLGLPLSFYNNSLLNVSYSFGQQGGVSNTLLRERYHMVALNLSLNDLWFVRRKYE